MTPVVPAGHAVTPVVPALLAVAATLVLTLPPTAATRVRTLRTAPPDRRPGLFPVTLALAALTAGPAAALALLAAVPLARVATRRREAARLARDSAAALPDLCRTVAAELRAGAPPPAALTRAADDAPPGLAAHLRRVATLTHPDPPPELRALAALWSVSGSTGAGLAEGVDRLADALTAEQRLRADTAAQLAGPRASAAVLAGLPVLGLVLAAALGARPLDFLATPLGLACLLAAAGLDATGVWWVRRLTA